MLVLGAVLGAASPSPGRADRPFPMLTFQIRTKWIPMVNGGVEKGSRYCVRRGPQAQNWGVLEAVGCLTPSFLTGVAQIKLALQFMARPLVWKDMGAFLPYRSS